MLRIRPRSLITIFIIFTLCTCIDPYSPILKGYGSLLVVDGLITDENTSYTVKLSKTIQESNDKQHYVSDATLFITGENGRSNYLLNKGNGIYKTDSINFIGKIGETYILHIITGEGNEYVSEPCQMQPVPEIDSIYYAKDQETINNGTDSQAGIRIFLDSKEGENNQYFRWAFEETWKFKVPYPKRFNFDMTDSAITAVPDVKEYCWKITKSDEINIHSIYTLQSNRIEKQPIFFIASDKSNRLLLQYHILINQYSISKKEYDFWNNLKQVNESGGDIFAKQPFTVVSNIYNINNPEERVLGYFQVSAVKQKGKYIPFIDIVGMNLPYFHYPCDRMVKEPNDYPNGFGVPPPTWDNLYSMFCITSDYYFVEPLYYPGTNNLQKMVFARPECANCELTGTQKKPDFWVDIN
ncbi:MAG: DUF4249 domain-containing protein [Bacteroidota bacterium]